MTAAQEFYRRVTVAIDRGETPVGIFYDLSRVDQALLIKKLTSYGIRGLPLAWFTAYLTGISQRVQFGQIDNGTITSHCSHLFDINMGVSQDAVLAPILFLLFINDLPAATDSFTIMYADDMSKLVEGGVRGYLTNRVHCGLDGLSE